MTKEGISLVGDPIVGLVEKPDGGLALESYVRHHLQQGVSHQLKQARLGVDLKPRKVVGQIILAKCAFCHLLDEIWWIGQLLRGRGSFKLD